MLAAVFAREGVLELQQRPIPSITRADEILIEVEGCGICGTDLHILQSPPGHPGTPGSIMGHEFIGRVSRTGDAVTTLREGQRVAVAPNVSCGLCAKCKAGRPNHCADFTTLGIFTDGGLARYCVAPERACHALADHVPFADAVWIEVLSCVVNSVDTVRAIALLERGVIKPSVLMSAIMPLERIAEALDLLRTGSAMKVAIRH
ncbi:hypothetical protein BH18ACI5_BH18ACI5_03510 [soil metagenome]